MDKTIGYCSKTIGCTPKSGFLLAETRCNASSIRPITAWMPLRSINDPRKFAGKEQKIDYSNI